MEPNTAPLSNYCAASYTKYHAQTVSLVKSIIDLCNGWGGDGVEEYFFVALADQMGKSTHTGINGNRIDGDIEHPAITIMQMVCESEPVPTKHYKEIACILRISIAAETINVYGLDEEP